MLQGLCRRDFCQEFKEFKELFQGIGFFIKNFKNLRNWLSADADVADATVYYQGKKRKKRISSVVTDVYLRTGFFISGN